MKKCFVIDNEESLSFAEEQYQKFIKENKKDKFYLSKCIVDIEGIWDEIHLCSSAIFTNCILLIYLLCSILTFALPFLLIFKYIFAAY